MESATSVALLRNRVGRKSQDDAAACLHYRDDEETLENLYRLVHLLEDALEEETPDIEELVGCDELAVLDEIAQIHKRIALGRLAQNNLVAATTSLETNFSTELELLCWEAVDAMNDDIREQLADCCLDWAIASKRADIMSDCFRAHLIRMKICPIYQITDAVRLLGLSKECWSTGGTLSSDVTVEQLPTDSQLFEVDRRPWMKSSHGDESYHASATARRVGHLTRNIFRKQGYTFVNCRSLLVPLFVDGEVENASHPERIFSANTFFRYRRDLAITSPLHADSINIIGLEVMARIFLFGLAVDRKLAERVIGCDDLGVLEEAGLATTSPACSAHIVGKVQVFPISQRDLFGARNCNDLERDETYLFVSDWPLESLRLPRHAIMSVGDDTLELMALSAGRSLDSGGNQRLLDLCCGCGIQGIFAWCFANSSSSGENGFRELVCADVNERALYFVVANICLNGVGERGYRQQDRHTQVYALRSDLYETMSRNGIEGAAAFTTSDTDTSLTFDFILTNPPFVAIPPKTIHRNPHTAPALYAIGGGVDGTAILERIVYSSARFLTDNPRACMLLVTEVPNVEATCKLIRAFMSGENEERKSWAVRVAYVGRDVESVLDYANARERETSNSAACRSWELPQLAAGVSNRALVLIGIFRHGESGIFKYGETQHECTEKQIVEEEDLFLTREGIEFGRSHLFDRVSGNAKEPCSSSTVEHQATVPVGASKPNEPGVSRRKPGCFSVRPLD